ncbi:MAG: diguanylate cyclase, partial [Gammaproteobacteria bacterium]
MPASSNKIKGQTDLLIDLEDLRMRLQEAEETLNAIRSGEVDALVVMGPQGEQIFTLKGAEQPYRILVEQMQEGAVTIGTDGTIMYCNRYFSEMLDTPLEQVIGSDIHGFVVAKDRPLFDTLFQQGVQAHSKGELHLETSRGSAVPAYISISSLAIEGAQGVCLIAADLTLQKRNEGIVASGRLAQSILDQAAEAIVVCDDAGTIIRASQAAHHLCGENLMLRHFDEVFPMVLSAHSGMAPDPGMYVDADKLDKDKNETIFSLSSVLCGKALKGMEASFTRNDEQVFNLLISAGELLDSQNKPLGCVVTMTDITERKQAEQRLAHLAQYDVLTGLPNRTLFRDRLSHTIARAARNNQLVALMFLDLDRFKEINDNMGHYVGDILLRSVAKRLSHCVREIDTVARLGGDEFTIILEEISNEEDVATIAQQILDSFSNPFIIDGYEIFITTSIGISTYTLNVHNVDTMLKDADVAMYHAKKQGRNNYQFHIPRMNKRSLERLNMASELQRALDQDEFRLYYQPQVELETGNIMGVEALVRWQHPDLGLINPSKFIDVAEDTGMIVPLGEWILKTACLQNKAWQDAGIAPLKVAVNHSAR